MRLLAIDTSNQTLSIAVCENEEILGSHTTTIKKNHSITLMPAIVNLMEAIQLAPDDLDRIVVAKGPGSYTGLRIGVTTAKTIAYSLKKELVGVSSLKILAANCVGKDALIVPLFDARRNNVYTGAYRYVDGALTNVLPDQHISMESWLQMLTIYEAIYFVGTDVEKFRRLIEEKLPKAEINQVPEWQIPNAVKLAQLGQLELPVVDIHSFLPDYLKRVEAEEVWLQSHSSEVENYVEKI